MSPVSQSDGHDEPRLIRELVPRRAAVVEDVAVGGEDPVGDPVLAQELPDVLDGVQLRRLKRPLQKVRILGCRRRLTACPPRRHGAQSFKRTSEKVNANESDPAELESGVANVAASVFPIE